MYRSFLVASTFIFVSVHTFACEFETAKQAAAQDINLMAKQNGAVRFAMGYGTSDGQSYTLPFFFQSGDGRAVIGTSQVDVKSCQSVQVYSGEAVESIVQ